MAYDTGCLACAIEHATAEQGSIELSLHTHNQASGTTGTESGIASGYTFDEYQDHASGTAIYPDNGKGTTEAIAYLCLKLNGEAGEVGEAYAKYLRGDYDIFEAHRRIEKELGDVLWYTSQIAKEFGYLFSDIAKNNIHKLADRKSRGVIRGSGDDR